MGFNSGILILNDALHEIGANPMEFTSGVVQAIQQFGGGLHNDDTATIRAGRRYAAVLFHMAHADMHHRYLIGGNCARRLPATAALMYQSYREPNLVDLDVLKDMAEAMGYRLVKRAKAK